MADSQRYRMIRIRKKASTFLLQENIFFIIKLNTLKIKKNDIVDQIKDSMALVVYRALPSLRGGSLEITLTVPFLKFFQNFFLFHGLCRAFQLVTN